MSQQPLLAADYSTRFAGWPSRWSPDREYRYTLWRTWNPDLPVCQFIGLNCSTADDHQLDPTVRRCIGYSKAWGYGSLCMTNLFAFRATDPRVMLAHDEPVGEMNDYWLRWIAKDAGLIVCCWGCHGTHRNRATDAVALLRWYGLKCLRLTKDGHPAHPLYLPKDLTPGEYR